MQEKIIETIIVAHEKPLHASGDARKRWVQRAPSGLINLIILNNNEEDFSFFSISK